MKDKINTEKMEGFFYAASKKLIFVPLVIIVLALVFKAMPAAKTSPISNEIGWDSLSPTVAPNSQKLDFNLKGPYICIYKEKGIDLKAYIKNRNVAMTIVEKDKTDKYLLKGDCAYLNDKKICSLTPYVLLLESMLKNNVSGLEEMWGKYSKTKVNFNKALKSCVKEDFKDTVFKLE